MKNVAILVFLLGILMIHYLIMSLLKRLLGQKMECRWLITTEPILLIQHRVIIRKQQAH